MAKIIDIESYEDRLVNEVVSLLDKKYKCIYYEPDLHRSSENRVKDLLDLQEKTKADFIVVTNLAYVPQAYCDLVHGYRRRVPSLVIPKLDMEVLVIYAHLNNDDSVEHRYIHKELKDYDGYLYEIPEQEIVKIPDMIDTAIKFGTF